MYPEYQSHKSATPASTPTAGEPCEPTPACIEGPFYRHGAPRGGESLCDYPTLRISGEILGTGGEMVPGATLDFWQADHKGNYDNELWKFRRVIEADKDSNVYHVWTVTPGCYLIAEGEYRCPHVHVKVSAPGYKLLTTQLYFPEGEHNSTDAWFNPALLLTKKSVRVGSEYRFDFVLEKETP